VGEKHWRWAQGEEKRAVERKEITGGKGSAGEGDAIAQVTLESLRDHAR